MATEVELRYVNDSGVRDIATFTEIPKGVEVRFSERLEHFLEQAFRHSHSLDIVSASTNNPQSIAGREIGVCEERFSC